MTNLFMLFQALDKKNDLVSFPVLSQIKPQIPLLVVPFRHIFTLIVLIRTWEEIRVPSFFPDGHFWLDGLYLKHNYKESLKSCPLTFSL